MEHSIDETLEYILFLTRHIRRGDHPAALLAVLIEMGFPVHMDGFEILMDAILIKRKCPKMRMSDVYNEIIKNSEESDGYCQIEQSIRSTIRTAWQRRNCETWLYFFSENEISRKYPSNKIFISQMAYLTELLSRCGEVSYETE